MPEEPTLSQLQQDGLLPKPLPPYSISTWDYVGGYLLWIVVGFVVVISLYGRSRQRRWKEKEDAIPTSLGPPTIRTQADRFVAELAAKELQPSESVQHQAYVFDRQRTSLRSMLMANAFYAVLTSRRLLLFSTRAGLFKPSLKSRGMEAIARDDIASCTVGTGGLVLTLRDRSKRTFFVEMSERHLSNQQAFRRNLPRLLGPAPAQRSLVRTA